MRIGVEDPPGVQNFSRCPARIPPAISMSSRMVIPNGASYWPGLATWPESEKIPWPVDFSVPMSANQSEPCRTIGGTEAMLSTLLTTVGRA